MNFHWFMQVTQGYLLPGEKKWQSALTVRSTAPPITVGSGNASQISGCCSKVHRAVPNRVVQLSGNEALSVSIPLPPCLVKAAVHSQLFQSKWAWMVSTDT